MVELGRVGELRIEKTTEMEESTSGNLGTG